MAEGRRVFGCPQPVARWCGFWKHIRAVESHARDWIGAAACFEGPRPGARFGDLPRPHKKELLRLAAAAAMSIAFFILLGISSRVLASRSLASRVVLPQAVAARPPALVIDQDAGPALLTDLTDLNDRPSSPPPVVHIYHRPFARQVMAIDAPPPVPPVQPDPPARSRNPVSRFVHAMVHATAVITSSPDAR